MKEYVIMFDIETLKAFTLSREEWEFWLAVNTEEGFSSAMPYYTFTSRELVN